MSGSAAPRAAGREAANPGHEPPSCKSQGGGTSVLSPLAFLTEKGRCQGLASAPLHMEHSQSHAMLAVCYGPPWKIQHDILPGTREQTRSPQQPPSSTSCPKTRGSRKRWRWHAGRTLGCGCFPSVGLKPLIWVMDEMLDGLEAPGIVLTPTEQNHRSFFEKHCRPFMSTDTPSCVCGCRHHCPRCLTRVFLPGVRQAQEAARPAAGVTPG